VKARGSGHSTLWCFGTLWFVKARGSGLQPAVAFFATLQQYKGLEGFFKGCKQREEMTFFTAQAKNKRKKQKQRIPKNDDYVWCSSDDDDWILAGGPKDTF
jgi:hypothetical protein